MRGGRNPLLSQRAPALKCGSIHPPAWDKPRDDLSNEPGTTTRGNRDMIHHPLVIRVLCVALVAALMMPLGRELFPYVEPRTGELPFDAIEAVVSATLGFGIYAALFG